MIDKKKAESLYKKSIDVLKKVQLKNGGCLATPIGERYPYIYPRDHTFCILGFLSAGLYKEAKKALDFVFNCQLESGAFPQRIDIKGNDASYKPIQIDGTGLILYAFHEYVTLRNDLKYAKNNWNITEKAVDYIIRNFHEERGLIFTPNSIHEFPPTEKGLEIWANSVCCSVLFKMSELAEELGQERTEWREHAERVKDNIIEYMWNQRLGYFIKNIRIKESSSVLVDIDASAYAVGKFHILNDNDGKVKSTVRRIERELWNKDLGGICRYPKHEGRNNGGWGPWPHFTLMLCRHFIRTENKKKVDKYLNWVIKIAYKDLLPEHISTKKEFEEYVNDFTEAGILRKDRLIMIENAKKHPKFKEGIAYITTPLAWPHAEFIRTWNLYNETFGK